MSKRTLSLVAFVALVMLALVLLSHQQAVPRNGPAQSQSAQGEPEAARLFTSPAGLRYGKDWTGKFENRMAHVMAHTRADPSKQKHSVFVEKEQEAIIALLDEAWKKRGPPEKQTKGRGRDVFDVAMGRVVGTEGERHIRIVVEADSADIVTAYPVN